MEQSRQVLSLGRGSVQQPGTRGQPYPILTPVPIGYTPYPPPHQAKGGLTGVSWSPLLYLGDKLER